MGLMGLLDLIDQVKEEAKELNDELVRARWERNQLQVELDALKTREIDFEKSLAHAWKQVDMMLTNRDDWQKRALLAESAPVETSETIGKWALSIAPTLSTAAVARRASSEMAELVELTSMKNATTGTMILEKAAEIAVRLHQIAFVVNGDLARVVDEKMGNLRVLEARPSMLDDLAHDLSVEREKLIKDLAEECELRAKCLDKANAVVAELRKQVLDQETELAKLAAKLGNFLHEQYVPPVGRLMRNGVPTEDVVRLDVAVDDAPMFKVGDRVRVRETGEMGTIKSVHNQPTGRRPYYTIRLDDQRLNLVRPGDEIEMVVDQG